MNIYLLELVGKWISFMAVSFVSLIGGINLSNTNLVGQNINDEKSLSIVNEVVPYETEYVYKSNIPLNVERVITPGVTGIVYTKSGEVVETLRDAVTEVVEYGRAPVGNYTGKMTGYGPDCKTCSGRGTVGCPAPGKVYHNLVTDGIYFKDKEYGDVRILAATKEEFRCGTIIEVENGDKKFYGIVLDRGSAMEKAYREGRIVIDLAFSSEANSIKEIREITNSNVKFNVQRWGF